MNINASLQVFTRVGRGVLVVVWVVILFRKLVAVFERNKLLPSCRLKDLIQICLLKYIDWHWYKHWLLPQPVHLSWYEVWFGLLTKWSGTL